MVLKVGANNSGIKAVSVNNTTGKITVAGYSNDNYNYSSTIMRFNSNGVVDSTFGTNGKQVTAVGGNSYADYSNSLIELADGSFLTTGYVTTTANSFFALQLSETGKAVSNYGVNGVSKLTLQGSDVSLCSAVNLNQQALLAGYNAVNASANSMEVALLDPSGSLNTQFNSGKGFKVITLGTSSAANACIFDSKGRIVLAGYSSNDVAKNTGLVRLNGTMENPTGVQTLSLGQAENSVTIYPVPVHNDLHIQSADEVQEVNIYSTLGQKVTSFSGTSADVSHLTKGLYIIEIKTSNKNFLRKILVQ